VERLEEVERSGGVKRVSAASTWTSSSRAPSASAAIWAITVLEPWPISVVLTITVTVPSSLRRTKAAEPEGATLDLAVVTMALPRPGGRGLSHSMARAQASRAAFSPTLYSTSPVAVSSPSLIRLRRRISTGSIPRARAMLSIWDS